MCERRLSDGPRKDFECTARLFLGIGKNRLGTFGMTLDLDSEFRGVAKSGCIYCAKLNKTLCKMQNFGKTHDFEEMLKISLRIWCLVRLASLRGLAL